MTSQAGDRATADGGPLDGQELDVPAGTDEVALTMADSTATAAAIGRRRRPGLLGHLGGLHHRAGTPARRRRPPGPGDQVEPPGEEPADHPLGRSRGGWTTKLHLTCEQGRKPLAMVITAGHRGDSPQFTRVLERIRVRRAGRGRPSTRPDRVLADKAYSSRANRAYLRRRSIRATIPIKRDQRANRLKHGSRGGRPPRFDPDIYRQRHAVECGSGGRCCR